MPAQTTIQVRRGTAASWTSTNPTLAAGEVGFETDTGKFKIGTGSTVWTGLAYSSILPNTVTTKGDLLAATGSATVDRLAAGSNGFTLVADSSTSTGLAYSPTFFAGKNKILNSDFSIWQRSTSATVTSETYWTCDRYRSTYIAGGATVTWSQQSFTAGAAPVAGYEGQYFSRISATSGSGTTVIGINQRIEDVRTLANQTATFSFWAKADSARTATILIVQNFGSGGSADVTVLNTTQALTTGWVRYSFNATVPSISGKTIGSGSYLVAYVYFNTGQASGSPQLDLWGWQLEAGSTATQFQTATGTIQGELAACQRYYYRNTSTNAYGIVGQGFSAAGNIVKSWTYLPVEMRVVPTAVDYSTLTFEVPNTGLYTVSAVSIADISTPKIPAVNLTVSTIANGLQGYTHFNNSTSAYLGFSAEL